MNPGQEDTGQHELVIIRRRHHDEDQGHHGGVWKIAYADFMTAMMAFFLVMWLINATDQDTLTQVANYFNPLQLSDKIASSKGLHDMQSGASGDTQDSGVAKTKTGESGGSPEAALGRPKFTEEALYKDPLGALDMLAHEVTPTDAVVAKNQRAVHNAAEGKDAAGQAYRDPFDPPEQFENPSDQAPPAPPPAVTPAGETKTAEPVTSAPEPVTVPEQPAPVAATEEKPADVPGTNANEMSALEPPAVPAPVVASPPAIKPEADKPILESRAAERAELEAAIKQMFEGAQPGTIPHIDVTITEEGLLISLTDEFDFGMFASGSVEPNPKLVVVMEKIARLLKDHSGPIVVRGHTDARPYRSETYDNWRLSAARAHMAYYMLLRGGIAEQRFERIEGHADRDLRIKSAPEAAQNRRIEILLRKPKP